MQLYNRSTLIERMIRAVRAVSSEITYFGPGPFRGFLSAVAGEVQHLYYKLFQVEQKLDVLAATGSSLDNYGATRGLTRNGASAASVLLELTANAVLTGTGTISSINGLTITGTGTAFTTQVAAGDAIVVGSTSATVQSVASNTSLTVATSLGVLNNSAYQVRKASVTLPLTAPGPLQVSGSAGVTFQITEAAVLRATYSGSSTLRGVVPAISTGTGVTQNVPAYSLTTVKNPAASPLVTVTATNPAAAQGGADSENDAVYRNRIVTLYAGLNQGTTQFYETQIRTINPKVIRVFLARGSALNQTIAYCLTSDGAGLDVGERSTIATSLAAYIPVNTTVTIENMVMQDVNVSFTTTLLAGSTVTSIADSLAEVYREYLNWSTWPYYQAVQADDLLRLAGAVPGVDSLTVSSFSPSVDVQLPAATLPRVGTITVQDATSGATVTLTNVTAAFPRVV